MLYIGMWTKVWDGAIKSIQQVYIHKNFIASGPAQDIAVSAAPSVIFEGPDMIQQEEIQ